MFGHANDLRTAVVSLRLQFSNIHGSAKKLFNTVVLRKLLLLVLSQYYLFPLVARGLI